MQQESHEIGTAFDVNRKYVRICAQRDNGFVEFEFAIGDPSLCVELVLPALAFHEFCLNNEVIMLDPVAADGGDWAARLNQAARQNLEDAV